MNCFERNRKLLAAQKEFENVKFTDDQLKKLEPGMKELLGLVLKGPDCKFEDYLHNYFNSVKDILKKDEEDKLASVKLKGPIYGVRWIEVDFGERDEGWALFVDLERCIKDTKKSSKAGPYEDGGGYLGPERPLCYYEIPLEGLKPDIVKDLKTNGRAHTENRWQPKYLGECNYIKE